MGADKRRSCGSLCWYPVTHNLSHLACSLPRQLRSDSSCLATARQQKSRLADTSKPYANRRNPMAYRVLEARTGRGTAAQRVKAGGWSKTPGGSRTETIQLPEG